MAKQRRWQSLSLFLRPMLLLSLGLHGLLLALPMPAEKAEIPVPEPDPETISVTRLPAASSLADSPAPSPQPAPPPPPAAKPAPPPPPAATAPKPTEPPVPPRVEPEVPEVTQETTDNTDATTDTSNPDDSAATTADLSLEDKLQDADFYNYSEAVTTDSEAVNVLSIWIEDLISRYSAIQPWPDRLSEPLIFPYALETCLTPEPVLASVGVVIKPTGELAEEPTLLKSTGYDILNQKALAEAKERSFPTGDAVKAYSLEVQVQYDAAACTPPAE
ncbi:hypothetical protein [Sphaerothrix gracilis]|uniref:hypothetical protein n=1 Tax=Sphaerothrix gracilis TaxID=3151835 RepID=UPI0031FC733E